VLTASDLKGVVAMMPAFTTKDGNSVQATVTIDTAELERAVDRIIRDGVDVIATTGSFGEFHTLLWEEQKNLIEATVAAVKKRVPLFIGCTSLNTREAILKMRFIEQSGADGVLTGVPFYFPSTVDNAVQYFWDIAEAFPRLAIMIYHNPPLHRVTIPVAAFKKLVEKPNIVAMKDSHRDPNSFMAMQEIIGGKINVFVFQSQLYPYTMLGAAGCWSIHVWMGPWPVIQARNACQREEWGKAKRICMDLTEASDAAGGRFLSDLYWRESSCKLAINEVGYCHAGPLRPPFRSIPEEVHKTAREIASKWIALCKKYPAVA
jgi:hydratase-aldolase